MVTLCHGDSGFGILDFVCKVHEAARKRRTWAYRGDTYEQDVSRIPTDLYTEL
jgi:hypothetical protein